MNSPNTKILLFQNEELTIYTPEADLTICFQDTLLVWIPCFSLIATSPFYAEYLRRRKTYNSFRDISLLNIVKGALSVLLSVAYLIRVCELNQGFFMIKLISLKIEEQFLNLHSNFYFTH